MATTVTWTQDANSNYEVSSAEHLKQLMHKGALYTDAGTPPSSYWAAGTNYKQTADIDLLSDSTDIKPIGTSVDAFFGVYDGGNFSISNWSYVDPEFATANATESAVGLFGKITDSSIQNLRLEGKWEIQGFRSFGGFLVGYGTITSAASTYGLRNIECNFSRESFVEVKSGDNTGFCGGIGGLITIPYVIGVRVRGFVDFRFENHLDTIDYTGGLFGWLNIENTGEFLENHATFPSGIHAQFSGGLFGRVDPKGSNPISKSVNAMTGDISGTRVGGIAGTSTVTTGAGFDTILNAMTGNITCTGTGTYDGAGGIIGQLTAGLVSRTWVNYMTGDIVAPTGQGGGLVGHLSPYPGLQILSSINAMNGNVTNAIFGVVDQAFGTLSTSDLNTNTSFGMTFTTDSYGTATPPSGMLTNSSFTDLPYVTLAGTDDIGNSYDLDFIYANLSGNSSYSTYTHLVLHKGDISAPFGVDFDIADTNTTVYETFINVGTTTVTQSGLTILSIDVIIPTSAAARSINIVVSVLEIAGSTEYQITYEGPTGGEIVAFSGTTDLTYNIVGLDPDTQYAVKLYADTGAGLVLEEEFLTTTLSNVAANYNITDFQENGVTDLTSLDALTLSNMSSVITELVNTGDVVSVSLPSNPELATSFVNVGGNISITDVDGILLPFDNTSGAGQTVYLTLSDNVTTVPIVYDEASNTIGVESVTYSAGDSFALDGNEIEVFDYYGLTILSIEEILPLAIEPRSINIPVVIGEVQGAIGYNVTIEGPTGGEITVLSGVTELEHNITGLNPETQYTVKLYVDTGTGYELTEELTTTTLPNVASNYDVTDFQEENGVTDLTSLDATTLSNVANVITELVNTGDVVGVSVESNQELLTSFVDVGEAINLADVDGLLLPFEVSSGAGQTVDLTLSDATTVPVTYDEVANTISVESETYSSGDAIYLDGNKLEVFDYYGLTVVSVDVAPLLVEPGPINIPVVITEVPGAVGYNVTYQGPTGGEITAFSGVTTLDQNITGLVSGTEYTIKLYADTGSGYVLTEELTATTLANVAANYDVSIFVQDGVINLSSLPENTISNIGEVMNELFNTGDTVNVSVQGKPEVNTSFIKLGETLSIKELDGVLLPFVEASGAGQDVNVVLSDGSTTVAIDYDDTVNNITVNGVVYYPGDSFVLDGQKVTVVEY